MHIGHCAGLRTTRIKPKEDQYRKMAENLKALVNLAEIRYEQVGDTIRLAHPSYPLKELTRTSDTGWVLATFVVVFAWGYLISSGSVSTVWPMFGVARPAALASLPSATKSS